MKTPLVAALLVAGLGPFVSAEEPVDLAAVHRIKEEAFKGSKVMDHLFYLADVHGPRLTASPGYKGAAEWAVSALKGWGIVNAALESWGPFGRGWTLTRFSAHMTEPAYAPLPGVVKAWSSGTGGIVRGPVIVAPLFPSGESQNRFSLDKFQAATEKYRETWAGKLKGRVVLVDPVRDFSLPTKAESERYDEKGLADVGSAPEPTAAVPVELPIKSVPADPQARRRFFQSAPEEAVDAYFEKVQAERDKFMAFLHDEGVLAAFSTDTRGEGSIIFSEAGGPYRVDAPVPAPAVVLSPELYNRLFRLADKKIPVSVEVEIAVQFDPPADGMNVVGEIPGGKKKDEVVMVGAHLDSWHGATGATDNGAGSAVALEVMRILKALNKPMDRTVRIALWSGEEQGLLGSRGYVKRHFADPTTMTLKPEHQKLSGYFNLDNGSGKIRGVYLQGNEMMRPIFEGWLAPFKDLGVETVGIRNTGGTDHLSFDQVGLPGFQFIQDPLDYGTRTHHSNLDTYDHAQAADLMQAAAVMATCVYQAATRAEMLPRKPLPQPAKP
jgi:carboxypeptidase Q